MQVLSLGAGVQSSTLLYLAHAGEIPAYDEVIFADTRFEPRAVYEHLDYLRSLAPITVVGGGDIREMRGRFVSLPLFVEGGGKLRRQCTYDYKIAPIRRQLRAWLPKGARCRLDLGISADEIHRARDSGVEYIENCYPLVDLGMRRSDCIAWITRHGYRLPPKSSCLGCPYHSDEYWRALHRDAPEEWAEVITFDEQIRELPRIKGKAYLHRSLKPMAELDFGAQPDLFGEECGGYCGV